MTLPVAPERVFYDGECGLCHRFVRFVVRQDLQARVFRFAPIGGEAFRAEVRDPSPEPLADSIVVLTAEGRLLTRSRAVLHVLSRLGRPWRALASLARLVPRPIADLAYGACARVRKRLFGRPESSCPLLPPELRSRFDP